MEILSGWLKGWRVKPPKHDPATGEQKVPSVVAISIEVPTCPSVVEVLRRITEDGEVVDVGLAPVQGRLELENTDRARRVATITREDPRLELDGGGA